MESDSVAVNAGGPAPKGCLLGVARSSPREVVGGEGITTGSVDTSSLLRAERKPLSKCCATLSRWDLVQQAA